MRWAEQVAHVAAKDVRGTLWVIAVTLITLMLATLVAVGALPQGGRGDGAASVVSAVLWGGPLFYVSAILLTGLLVQADRPGEGDSFWVTRPLAPTAVLGAKLLVIAVVLWLIPLVGQYVALRAYDVAPAEGVRLAAVSGVVFGGLLASALAAAVVSPDLRSYFITLILGALGWSLLLASFRVSSMGLMGPSGVDLPASVVWIAVGATTAALQYRWRRLRRTLAVVLPLLVAGAWWVSSPSARALTWTEDSAEEPSGGLRATDLRVSIEGIYPGDFSTAGMGRRVQLMFQLRDATPGYRYTLRPSIWVDLPDGTSHLVSRWGRPLLLSPGTPQGGRGPGRAPDGGFRAATNADLAGDLAESVRQGGGVIRVEGRVQVAEARRLPPIPARVGSSLRSGRRRVEVTAVEGPERAPAVALAATQVAVDWEGWSHSPFDDMDVALTAVPGGAPVGLRARSGGGGVSRPLLLPGVELRSYQSAFSVWDAEPVDAVPLQAALLVVTEWADVGGYEVKPSPVTLVIRD